jgi:hypothetical protein
VRGELRVMVEAVKKARGWEIYQSKVAEFSDLAFCSDLQIEPLQTEGTSYLQN